MQLGQGHGTTPDYDYYAATQQGQSSAPAQGGAAAQRGGWGTTNQFGSPTAATATYAHTPTVAPKRTATPVKVARVLAPLGIAVVAGFFGLGQLGFINPPDLDPPATLGGQAASTDPGMQAMLATVLGQVRAQNTDLDVRGQVYGSPSGDIYLLMTGDGRTDLDAETADAAGTASPPVVEIDGATCTTLEGVGETCIRTSFTRTMIVVTTSMTGPGASTDTTAALLNEAWD